MRSWEALWVVWTTALFAGYVVFVRTSRWWLGSSRKPATPTLDYDPNARKQFSPKSASELGDLADEVKTARETKTQMTPHIGLWLTVEGEVQDIGDDEGDDGEGGRWASVGLDYRPEGKRKGYPHGVWAPPRLVTVYFMGADATAVRAFARGDYIKANGRIHSMSGFMGGMTLIPGDIVEYRSNAGRPIRLDDPNGCA